MVAVLREVKYLEMAENESLDTIPESATAVFARNEEFHKYCGNLDLIVAWYNKVRLTILSVEFPLIENQLQAIDNHLQSAEETLQWNSEGITRAYWINVVLFIHSIFLHHRDNYVNHHFRYLGIH